MELKIKLAISAVVLFAITIAWPNTPHKRSAVVVSAKSKTDSNREEIEWRFTDDQGRAWIVSGLAEASKEKTGAFNVNVRLTRTR